MARINLREFYSWYEHDEYIEVPDAVAEELFADKRYHKSHKRRMYRNKSHYSLDVGDGIENSSIYTVPLPYEIVEKKEQLCRLCAALNSLPQAQGKRVEARYICGMLIKDIAKADGVSPGRVSESIRAGLRNMKKYLNNQK